MAEKKAKKSELEKFTEFAELKLKKNEEMGKRAGLENASEYWKKHTADSYAKEKVGEKPVAPQDVTPNLDGAFFLWGALGILLIVAPIILFIVNINLGMKDPMYDPMGLSAIIFILIVLAFIFVKQFFEKAGDALDIYKSDLAIHKEYPTKKYQYDSALAKWNRDYANYKRQYPVLRAKSEKDLETLEEELSKLDHIMGEEYADFWFKFDDEASLALNDNQEIIEDNNGVRTFGRIKEILLYTKKRGEKQKVSAPTLEEDCKAIFEYWVKEGKGESFCAPLAEAIKKKLEENKKYKIFKAANEILEELYNFANRWKILINIVVEEKIEWQATWELCNSCWKLHGGQKQCPMAPRSECAAYVPN